MAAKKYKQEAEQLRRSLAQMQLDVDVYKQKLSALDALDGHTNSTTTPDPACGSMSASEPELDELEECRAAAANTHASYMQQLNIH